MLRRKGYKAAKISPHVEGAALDMAIPSSLTVAELISLFRETAQQLDLPSPRIGHLAYEDKFLHVDLVHMKFKPYTAIENPKPQVWFEGAEW